MQFDFFGNFRNLTKDIENVLRAVDLPSWMLSTTKEHSKVDTSELMQVYFGDMTVEDRRRLKQKIYNATGHPFLSIPQEG